MQILTFLTQQIHSWVRPGRMVLALILAGAALGLSACMNLLVPPTPARTPVVLDASAERRAEIALDPTSGYAGVYVQVSGAGWTPGSLVLVALSDEVGRSSILAATNADPNGQIVTGFLYPISPRWLTPGAHTVVAYTEEGNLQATAEFLVTPPDGQPLPTGTPASPEGAPTPTATATPIPTATPTESGAATPTPTATATPAPTPLIITDWLGEYFSNEELAGRPSLVRNDVAIFFDWGASSPGSQLPADHFSARWTRTLRFDAGVYRFFVEVDDGARLFIDDELVLDEWRLGAARTVSATASVSAGEHTVRVEFFERTGDARIRFWWERQATFVGWEGAYFANPELQGDPVLVRDDAVIDFNWGDASPGDRVPADNFSARWRRQMHFEAGRYRFYARMDDGMRVYVDGERLLDEWREGADRTLSVDVELASGVYLLTVEYFERGGGALASFWWELLPEPTPTWTPSWTPTATATPSSTPTATATWTPTWTATATPSPTPMETPTQPVTVSPTPSPTATPTVLATASSGAVQPLGTPVAFQPFTMPLLRRPEEPIFRAITTQAEWEALLQELALRPGETPGGRGRSTDDQPAPTAVPGPRPSRTPAARGLVRGEAPNFRQEVLFLAMLEQESTYRRVEITDVRRQGSKVYVQVRLVEEKAAPGLPTWASAAVTVLRRALPQDFSTAVVFVSEEGDVLHTTRLFKR